MGKEYFDFRLTGEQLRIVLRGLRCAERERRAANLQAEFAGQPLPPGGLCPDGCRSVLDLMLDQHSDPKYIPDHNGY